MSPTHRLPEDAAAEMAYLAELHGQQAAAEQRRAESRRALMEGRSSVPPTVGPSQLSQPQKTGDDDSLLGDIAPEQLLHLSPAILAGLPKEVQAAVEAARSRRARAMAGPGGTEQTTGSSAIDEASRAEEVLKRVNMELYENESVLVGSPKRASFVQTVGQFLDGLLGAVTRRGPW